LKILNIQRQKENEKRSKEAEYKLGPARRKKKGASMPRKEGGITISTKKNPLLFTAL